MLTPQEENIVRVCTRNYMDSTNDYPANMQMRSEAVMASYKAIGRLVDKIPSRGNKTALTAEIGRLIASEWEEYE